MASKQITELLALTSREFPFPYPPMDGARTSAIQIDDETNSTGSRTIFRTCSESGSLR